MDFHLLVPGKYLNCSNQTGLIAPLKFIARNSFCLISDDRHYTQIELWKRRNCPAILQSNLIYVLLKSKIAFCVWISSYCPPTLIINNFVLTSGGQWNNNSVFPIDIYVAMWHGQGKSLLLFTTIVLQSYLLIMIWLIFIFMESVRGVFIGRELLSMAAAVTNLFPTCMKQKIICNLIP